MINIVNKVLRLVAYSHEDVFNFRLDLTPTTNKYRYRRSPSFLNQGIKDIYRLNA